MSVAVLEYRKVGMEPSQHLRAVPDSPPTVSRHAPDPASVQRLDDLLVASGRGSAQAFEGVYTAMLNQVYRLALRVVRDPGMAEDIAQEALVEAWRKAPTFEPGRGTAKSWVLTIAHRRAVDRVRREQRQRQQMEAEAAVAEREATPAEQDAVVERDFAEFQNARVRTAVATLSDKQREAVELAFYQGQTHVEVSDQLGIPLGTAKTRIRDALTKLRDALEEV
ncbi:sigma-70 family RNA polymerase sigma factor [Demequina oxidasica]|uniref:sigma-70 family RNA polymerase sigma factor n=1 Tax=Demequina oxidasica TaxID=676199 RepID=UPI000AD81C32|nr:sigma-70 family RNA polymerase sigma factor [Demequina oxidasica]